MTAIEDFLLTPSEQWLLKRTVQIDFEQQHKHLPGSLSALPVIADIYRNWSDGDVFILSKGHAAAAWYAVLEWKGLKPDVTKPHPERDVANGVTVTTGSLGHGLPLACGVAFAKQRSGDKGTVHVLLGDGECAEGTTWEGLLMAEMFKLANLVIHVDGNGGGCLGKVSARTSAVVNLAKDLGLDLRWHHTQKGCGIPSLEGTADHVYNYNEARYQEILREIEVQAQL